MKQAGVDERVAEKVDDKLWSVVPVAIDKLLIIFQLGSNSEKINAANALANLKNAFCKEEPWKI